MLKGLLLILMTWIFSFSVPPKYSLKSSGRRCYPYNYHQKKKTVGFCFLSCKLSSKPFKFFVYDKGDCEEGNGCACLCSTDECRESNGENKDLYSILWAVIDMWKSQIHYVICSIGARVHDILSQKRKKKSIFLKLDTIKR